MARRVHCNADPRRLPTIARAAFVREQELRIALVCFGGVSLAVYMHGISKEILKLVRASCALHAIADRQARMTAQFFDRFDARDPEFDTEAVYFELLREIGRKLGSLSTSSPEPQREASMEPSWRGPSATIYRSASCAICGSTTPLCPSSSPRRRARARSKWILKPFIWGGGPQ